MSLQNHPDNSLKSLQNNNLNDKNNTPETYTEDDKICSFSQAFNLEENEQTREDADDHLAELKQLLNGKTFPLSSWHNV